MAKALSAASSAAAAVWKAASICAADFGPASSGASGSASPARISSPTWMSVPRGWPRATAGSPRIADSCTACSCWAKTWMPWSRAADWAASRLAAAASTRRGSSDSQARLAGGRRRRAVAFREPLAASRLRPRPDTESRRRFVFRRIVGSSTLPLVHGEGGCRSCTPSWPTDRPNRIPHFAGRRNTS